MSAAPVALVTGSARGLGLAIARHLAARGDRVHVTWRTDGPDAEALRAEFGARAHHADLTRPSDVESLIADTVALDGRLDILVHAVGEYLSGPLEGTTAGDLARMFESNATSSLRLFNAARPHLRSSRGNALFFGCSGLPGLRARTSTAAYTAAKTALLVLVKSWAREEAPHAVRVNLLSPGQVPHPGAHPDTLDPALQSRIPLGRPGTPADIAEAASFLTSSAASHITGVDLEVAGGWML
ncbi:MAG TPA: SDR family oxidoreductase [Planctomycetes bacterium]|nr:SDR family oxidoreductase [Planctomycetota bacterium]